MLVSGQSAFLFYDLFMKHKIRMNKEATPKPSKTFQYLKKMAWLKMLNQCSTLTVLLALTDDVSKIHVKHVYFLNAILLFFQLL